MARSIKRTAPSTAAPQPKKKRTSQAQLSPSPSLDGSDSEVNEFALDGLDGLGGAEDDDEELDSEDEFAGIAGGEGQEGMDEDEDEEESGESEDGAGSDEDLIGDDDEDLHAGLGAGSDGMSEDDGEENGGMDDDGWETVGTAPSKPLIAPAAELEKERKGKGPKPLSAAELRALAFAELTASPISNVLSTQVAGLLNPLTPPAPASSPLQPILKSLHAHLTGLLKQKPVSLAGLRKKGVVVPKVEGGEGKWAKMDLAWEKPRSEDVRVVGKWAWGGGLKEKGEYVVELAVAMPPVRSSLTF